MNDQSPRTQPPEDKMVYVVEDDEALRTALDALLRSAGLPVRCFGAADDFLQAELTDASSCLLLDVRLPGMSGLDFHARLIAAGIALPVIFMTGYGDIPMSVQAMKAGAVDFLTKPFRDQDLLDAVIEAIRRDGTRRQQMQGVDSLAARYATLSPRERQVMQLVVSGLMNKQVAGELKLSEVTVKIHRGHVMKKMGTRSLADLVRAFEALKRASVVE